MIARTHNVVLTSPRHKWEAGSNQFVLGGYWRDETVGFPHGRKLLHYVTYKARALDLHEEQVATALVSTGRHFLSTPSDLQHPFL